MATALVAPQGLGKTTLAKNIAHRAVLAGHSVLFVSASQMLLDFSAHDSTRGFTLRIVEIALAVGCASQSHLTEQCRRIVGVTPGRAFVARAYNRDEISDETRASQRKNTEHLRQRAPLVMGRFNSIRHVLGSGSTARALRSRPE